MNNAGLNASSGYQGPKTTSQGYDICMGVNYLGHFMLTSLLLPLLMKSEDGARVVALSFGDDVVRIEQVSLLLQGSEQDERKLRIEQAGVSGDDSRDAATIGR